MPISISDLNDNIVGTAGDDLLSGLGGDDTIDGYGGVDTLYGGTGNDILYTRTDDLAYGGDGDDILSVAGDGPAEMDGGTGFNVLRFEGGYDVSNTNLLNLQQAWIAGTATMTTAQLASFQLISGYNSGYTSAGINLSDGGTATVVLSGTLTNYFSLTGSGVADRITFDPGYTHTIYAYMGGGADKVTTAAGNDSIRGEDGNDTLNGLGGNDSIDGGAGADSLVGGDGNDLLLVYGADTAVGGNGDDLISIGGNNAAILAGGANVDLLRFEGAYDISGATLSGIEQLLASSNAMMTAAQLDQFTKVSGYDTNYTTAGVTLTQGGTADVTLSVSLSNYFSLTGSSQADLITFAAGFNAKIYAYMGGGNDSVATSAGADSIRGEGGSDTLLGWGGDDSIDGGSGADSINGGSGNDLLIFGTGDTVLGGSGDDMFALSGNVPASLDGGIGNDTLRFEGSFDLTGATLTGFEQLNAYANTSLSTDQLAQFGTVAGYSAAYTTATLFLTHGGAANVTVASTLSNYIAITGSSEADALTFTSGYLGAVNVAMGGGNDSILASSGNDSLRGDDGDDTLSGANGNDSVDGGTGVDSLYGGNGDDLLILRFWDSAYGGANNDILSINDNAPVSLDGGANFDILRLEGNYDITGATITGIEQLNLNSNATMTATQLGLFGTVSGYSSAYTTAGVTLSEGGTATINLAATLSAYFGLTGSTDADLLTFGPAYTGTIYGYVGGGDDSLLAASGNDSLRGEDGNDSLYGYNGNDAIDGGNGNDLLSGQNGNDTIDGGNGIDSILGGAGDDLLYARMGDSVYGGNDNDLVSVAETLPAWLDGGLGNDTLRFENGFDITGTKVTGFETLAANGTVMLTAAQLNGFSLVQGYTAGYTSAAVKLTVGGTVAVNLASGLTSYFSLSGSSTDDKVTFNAGFSATIYAYGAAGNDSITAGSGADSLRGDQGNDTLIGLGGNDSIDGGAGADVINGGSGFDQLTGGIGRDIFVFGNLGASDPLTPDRINDFEGAGAGQGDTIDVSNIDADGGLGVNDSFIFGSTGLGGLSVVDSGTDTLVRLNTDNDAAFEVIILIADGGVLASAYTAADFLL